MNMLFDNISQVCIIVDENVLGGIVMEIKKIGIAGSGTMGSSLAETFAKFGYEV